MKRIMFYKNDFRIRRAQKPGKELRTAELLMVFSVFLCGTVLGCTFFNVRGCIYGFGMNAMEYFGSVSPVKLSTNTCVIGILIVISFIFCSFSCFGAVPLCLLAAFSGARFAVLASAFISANAWKGYLIFIVLFLPGGILISLAELVLFSYGISVAKKTAGCVFNAVDMHIGIKDYVKNMVVPVLLIPASALTDFVMRLLFGGMVYSGI